MGVRAEVCFFYPRVVLFQRPEHHWVLMERWELRGFIHLSTGFVGMGRLGGAGIQPGSQSLSPKPQKFPGKFLKLEHFKLLTPEFLVHSLHGNPGKSPPEAKKFPKNAPNSWNVLLGTLISSSHKE